MFSDPCAFLIQNGFKKASNSSSTRRLPVRAERSKFRPTSFHANAPKATQVKYAAKMLMNAKVIRVGRMENVPKMELMDTCAHAITGGTDAIVKRQLTNVNVTRTIATQKATQCASTQGLANIRASVRTCGATTPTHLIPAQLRSNRVSPTNNFWQIKKCARKSKI